MVDPARTVERTYLVLTLLTTLASSFIWGINTIFLLDAGLDNAGAFAANAFYTLGQVIFEVPTGVVADTRGRQFSYVLGAGTLLLSTVLYLVMWQVHAPLAGWAIASILLGLGFTFFSGATEAWLVDALRATGFTGHLEQIFGRAQMVSGAAMLVGTVSGGVIAQATNLGVPYVIRAAMLGVTLIVNGTGVINGALENLFGGSNVWSGNVFLNTASTIAAGGGTTLSITGSVSGPGNLTTAGIGTVVLASANAYTGNTVAGRGAVWYDPKTGVTKGVGAGYAGDTYTGQGPVRRGGVAYNTSTRTGIAASSNNLYAGKNGDVYRYNPQTGNWSQNGGNGWKGSSNPQVNLQQQQHARAVGQQRMQNFSGSMGGGMRMGGRRR